MDDQTAKKILRVYLQQQQLKAILDSLVYDFRIKTERSTIQSYVSEKMGCVINNDLIHSINKYLESKGVKAVRNHGRRCYRGCGLTDKE